MHRTTSEPQPLQLAKRGLIAARRWLPVTKLCAFDVLVLELQSIWRCPVLLSS